MEPIRYNLARLLQFSGRETRGEFWPYVGFIFLVSTAAMFVLMATLVLPPFYEFANAHPNQATVVSGPTSYSVTVADPAAVNLAPTFGWAFAAAGIWLAAVATALAAAVSRRLHDRGLPGFIGLVPLPFAVLAFWLMHQVFGDIASLSRPPDIDRFFESFAANMVYNLSVIGLAIVLALPSTLTANRHGPAPASPKQPNFR